jgi:3-hydroxyisobutyrate dehydrogenase
MKIGFIGIGRMGHRMVGNLMKGGQEVCVYDANPSAIESMVAQGAKGARSIAEVVRDKDVVISMLPTPPTSVEVYCGKEGLFAQVPAGTLVVECSTVDVATIELLGAEAQRRSVTFVDAPVTGGIEGAEAGTLTFMVGGTNAEFKRLKPALQFMGKKFVYAGPFGNGTKLKLINNMICASNLIVAGEALALGLRLGLDAKTMYDVISSGSGASWVFNTYYPLGGVVPGSPSSRGFRNPTFPVTGMVKDMQCALDAAARTGAITPMNALASSLLRLYGEQFGTTLDWTAVSTLFKSPAAVDS